MSSGHSDGFIWVKFQDFTLISCYLSPNQGILAFKRQLADLEDTIRRIGGEVIVAGDFNAKSTEWGMEWSDTRGNEVADMAARLDLPTLNEGNVSSFRRPGCRESILDITFGSPETAAAVWDWRVLEDYNSSDHQYIQFSTGNAPTNGTRQEEERRRWNDRKLNETKLINSLKNQAQQHANESTASRQDVENLVEKTMGAISAACDASMPTRSTREKRRANYWWNDDISELRKKCLALRRKSVRANRRRQAGQPDTLFAELDSAKKALKRAIKKSKNQCWNNLCDELDEDPWGKVYQIAVRGLGKQSRIPPMEPAIIERIIGDLFPQHPRRVPRGNSTTARGPPFTSGATGRCQVLETRQSPWPGRYPCQRHQVYIQGVSRGTSYYVQCLPRNRHIQSPMEASTTAGRRRQATGKDDQGTPNVGNRQCRRSIEQSARLPQDEIDNHRD